MEPEAPVTTMLFAYHISIILLSLFGGLEDEMERETTYSVPDTLTNGPLHSSYPKVVVPSKITCVPEVKEVRSSVTPEGTATFLRMIVEQVFLEAEALAAPLEPEKVHVAVVARSARMGVEFGAGVGAGAGAASVRVSERRVRKAVVVVRCTILETS